MFLLVYVHSRMHDDTDTFVRDLLCRQELVDFVDENFMCFLGSINKPEAFAFVQSLGITGDSIPFQHAPHTLTTQSRHGVLCLCYCVLLFPPFFSTQASPPAFPWLGVVHQAASSAPLEVLQWKEGVAGDLWRVTCDVRHLTCDV
jgi:hypothetical protein